MDTKYSTLAHSAQQLLQQARTQTGIDIVDTEIAETLERFVQALNTEAHLSEAGASAMERHILLVLTNRLRMQRDYIAHPEIAEIPFDHLLILSGAARTGSTKLHKLLAASGDFLWLPCWQGISLSLLNGERNEDTTPRIREAEWHVRWFNDHAPRAKLIHEFSTYEPEEENLILAQRFFAPYMQAFVFVPRYLEWYLTHRDMRDDIAFLKRGLQYLHWQFHRGDTRPWLLKNPLWPGLEPLLLEAFPGATFASTHRESVSVISSSISLLANYHVAYSDAVDSKTIAAYLVGGLSQARQMQIAARDARPDIDILDLAYRDVAQNVDAVVERLYAHAGMTLTQGARVAMHDWERKNAQHKLGVHRHDLKEFGLTESEIVRTFAAYSERFRQFI